MITRNKSIVMLLMLLLLSSFLHGDLWEIFTRDNSGLPSNEITAIAIDSDSTVWIGTRAGLARYRNNHWTVYNTSNSQLPSDTVHALTVHPLTDHIWIGTNFGLARFDGTTWSTYNMANSGLPRNVVTSVAIDQFGTVWAGTLQGGLARFVNNNWMVFRTTNSDIPHNNVRALAATDDGKVWIGTDNGLAAFRVTDWEVFNRDNSGLPDNSIKKIAKFDGTSIVVGTEDGGIVIIVDEAWMLFHVGNSILPSNTISAIAAKDNGIFWIGTPYSGFVKSNNLQMRRYNTDNSDLINDQISAIAVGANNKKWIGTAAGLVTYNEISVAKVVVEPDTLIIPYSESEQLQATILPANATNKRYSWVSSNEDVATVNDTGYVTTHIPGIAFVRAISDDGMRSGSCYVYVTGRVAKPQFDPPSGNYEEVQYVTITSETDNALIYYTLDESEPNEESYLFTEPIKIDAPVTIRARAFRKHWIASEIAESSYHIDTAVEDHTIEEPLAGSAYIYPNPIRLSSAVNSQSVTISYQAKVNEQIEISIFDIRGRKVRSYRQFAALTGENRFSFSVDKQEGTLPQGIYLYSVRTPNNVNRGKFSIIR